ncbi:hypothetical protein [Massilibacteroides sp.]|uniref:hypothetical protein n=1 Tax=Massilibacteroides sp. TaxID=2034766 RepID=UPI002620770A|nr:hypothetical protein [Massilibacteroides sp.]MDD4515644.1 hypothetical protein [Massilibacteroides sp.]
MHIIEIISGIIDEVKADLLNAGQAEATANLYNFPNDAPYFDYGSWIEIDKNLIEKGKSNTYKSQRFPLIFLRLPVTVEKNVTTGSKYYRLNSLELYFFVETDEKKSTQWRNDNKKPTLIALTDAFLYRLKKHSEYELIIQETYIPYMEGTAFALSTPVDCMKITITDLTITELCLT